MKLRIETYLIREGHNPVKHELDTTEIPLTEGLPKTLSITVEGDEKFIDEFDFETA